MEYQRKRQPTTSPTHSPWPDVQPVPSTPLALQRALHKLTTSPTAAQCQAVQPVLRAATLQRHEDEVLTAQRLPLQRQVSELGASLSANAIETALQRQASERTPAVVPNHPVTAGDWVTIMRHQAEQVNGTRLDAQSTQAFTTLQRQVTSALVQSVKLDPRPAMQRHADFARHAVTLQRHALTKHIPRAALSQLPPGERVSLQRAVDEATQADTLQRQQDDQALQLHSLQRQLAELDEQAAKPVMERIQARRGSGNPLPTAVQRHLEQGLNHDLSAVRIHDDAEADKLAKVVNAVAFTTGTDIYFRSGMFNPNTQTGLELLAHEVTHTVQQSQGKVGKGIDPDAGLEAEARSMGAKLANLTNSRGPSRQRPSLGVLRPVSTPRVQRLGNPQPSPTPWDLQFKGSLAGKGITVSLRHKDAKIHGHYIYSGENQKINLEGEISNGKTIYLKERISSGKVTGFFEGSLAGNGEPSTISGLWKSPDGQKGYKFIMKKTLLLDHLPTDQVVTRNYSGSIGNYKINMHLDFKKDRSSGYYYYLNQGSQKKIPLNGSFGGGRLILRSAAEEFSAPFSGKYDAFEGTWKSPSSVLKFFVGPQTSSPGENTSLNPKFIDAIIELLPIAMMKDPDKYGKSRLTPDFKTNRVFRERTELIVNECVKSGITNKDQIAYILITAAHESAMGANMRERLWTAGATQAQEQRYFENNYGPNGSDPARAIANGNKSAGDGYKYRGRGYVQLTWANNYIYWNKRLTDMGVTDSLGKPVDLINDPEIVARDPKIAAVILVQGMRDGAFRPAKGPLSKYFSNGNRNFSGARAVVNGDSLGPQMGRAAEALADGLKGIPLHLASNQPVTLDTKSSASQLNAKIVAAAIEGLSGNSTTSLAYSCSKWTRQVVTRHVDPNRTLFGGSARETYERFRSASLTRPYSGMGDVKPGDILFWDVPSDYWHVAIYLGGDKVAGNHYAIYLKKYKAIKASGRPLPGQIAFWVGNMPVYSGIDARGSLPMLQVAGKTPIAIATIPAGWKPK